MSGLRLLHSQDMERSENVFAAFSACVELSTYFQVTQEMAYMRVRLEGACIVDDTLCWSTLIGGVPPDDAHPRSIEAGERRRIGERDFLCIAAGKYHAVFVPTTELSRGEASSRLRLVLARLWQRDP